MWRRRTWLRARRGGGSLPRLIYSETEAEGADCFWTVTVLREGAGTPRHCVLPDGCWTLSVGVRPAWYVRLRPPATAPFVAPCTPGEVVTGVRFRPGLPPRGVLERARRVLKPGQSAAEISWRLGEIVRMCDEERDPRIDLLAREMRCSGGRSAVSSIAEKSGISERHLERLSLDQLGLAPKTFARIIRLQAALRHMIAHPERGLAEVASESGYADQTHMGRDFRRLGRMTPAGYRRSIEHVGFVLETRSDAR